MKIVPVLVLVLVLGSFAAASPLVKPPAGWTGGVDDHLIHTEGGVGHFGGVHGIVEGESYKPSTSGIVLYVARIAATTSAASSDARAEIDRMHPPQGTSVDGLEYRVGFDPHTKLVELAIKTRDPGAHIATTSRTILAAAAERIVEVTGECIYAETTDPGILRACVAALDTLDTGIDAKDRVAIDLDARSSTSTSTTSEPVKHVPLPPMAVPHEEPRTDLRPVVVGAALLVMAAFFWWNHRRRSKIGPNDG